MQYPVIRDLLDNLGPAWPRIQAADRLGEDTWLFALDGERILIVEWIAQRQSLLLTTGIGTPEVDRRFNVYEQLLCFNSLPEGTASHFALDHSGGEMLLCKECAPNARTAADMQDELDEFCRAAAHWNTLVCAPAQDVSLNKPGAFIARLLA